MSQAIRAKSAYRRKSIPGESVGEARLLAMVAALTSELAMVRERIDTTERLLETAGLLDRAAVDAFDPPPELADERTLLRQRLIAKTFRPLRDAAERDAAGDTKPAPGFKER